MRQTRLNHRIEGRDEAPAFANAAKSPPAPFEEMMSLQGTIGNAAVRGLVRASERAATESPTPVDGFTQGLIARQTGAEVIDAGMGSGVRVHHGPQSDALTRMLRAQAFTQGQDVFLRSDRHPSSEAGQATLAHEFTHVAMGSTGKGAVMREPDTGVEEATPLDSSQKSSSVVAKITLESGDVSGESTVPGHKGELDFESLGFVSPRPGMGSTGTREGSDAKTRELSGARRMDGASAKLAEAVAKGERIVSARFTFVKIVDKDIVEEVMTFDFKDGYVTSYQVSGEFESLTFSFDASK